MQELLVCKAVITYSSYNLLQISSQCITYALDQESESRKCYFLLNFKQLGNKMELVQCWYNSSQYCNASLCSTYK